MREILFRGKRIDNGKWEYGGCVSTENEVFLIYNQTHSIDLEPHTVEKRTIGQYTGLTDKNGKKIFENDIVLCAEPLGMAYREIRGKVVYKLTGFVVDCGGFNTTLSGGLCQTPYYVIGNIHDNPELLDGKPDD